MLVLGRFRENTQIYHHCSLLIIPFFAPIIVKSVGLILLILDVVGLLETNKSLSLLLAYVLSSRMVSVKIFGWKGLTIRVPLWKQ